MTVACRAGIVVATIVLLSHSSTIVRHEGGGGGVAVVVGTVSGFSTTSSPHPPGRRPSRRGGGDEDDDYRPPRGGDGGGGGGGGGRSGRRSIALPPKVGGGGGGDDRRRRSPAAAAAPAAVVRRGGGGNNVSPRRDHDYDDDYYHDDGELRNRGERLRRQQQQQQQRQRQQRERLSSSIACPHFGTCPGCVRDDRVSEIDVVKSARLYFSSPSVRRHVVSPPGGGSDERDDADDNFYKVVVPSPVTGWRTQAKLAIAPKSLWTRNAGCVVGLYARASHDVIGIPECRVHHPSVNRAIELLTIATSNVRTPAYREDTGEGLLRHAMARVDTATGRVCLTLVMNAERYKDCQPQLSQLAKELRRLDNNDDIDGGGGGGGLFHSIWCHCNDSRGNAIFSRDVTRWHPVDGMPYLRERIPADEYDGDENDDDGGDDDEEEEEEDPGYLYFSPHVFRQANFEGFADIAREVREAIRPGSKVCELYAGVGMLGLSALLHHGRRRRGGGRGGEGLGWLRCSDENPENAKCFERSVGSMPARITGREATRDNGRFRRDGGGGGGRGRGGRGRGGGRDGRGQRRGGGGGGRGGSANGEQPSIKDLMDSVMSSDGGGGGNGGRFIPETDPSERVTYMQANAASALYRGQALGADVLIVDPPRKGLDEVVLQQLSQKINTKQMYAEKPTLISHLPKHTINWTNDVRTVVYVSCGFDALARDLDVLLSSNGGWKLESATGYVLFPGSNHVETVVVLRR